MKGITILTIVAIGVAWAFDAHEFDGRNSKQIWAQSSEAVRYLSHEMQAWAHSSASARFLTGHW
jgi:hypothetical protein